MEPVRRITAVAAPLDLPNVDTDRIIPARFLRKPKGAPGYDRFLFHDLRYDAEERERPEFVLNQPPYRDARILVTAENFGCGSSREMAVWALDACGFRAVIGPSFGDIFFENCFKNGLLAIVLPAGTVANLRRRLHEAPGAIVDIDLPSERVSADGTTHHFEIDPFRKEMLLTGRDEIGFTLGYEREIAEFEDRHVD
jgi:3-isopropylmalate/(R)-2-methylmalate dehydratase small subunit